MSTSALQLLSHLDPFAWWLVHQGIDLADADGSVLGPLRSDAIWEGSVDTDIMVGPPGWLTGLGSLALAHSPSSRSSMVG